MRYLDTGRRDPAQALGTWLQEVLDDNVEALRFQSGFFTADGLGLFGPTLERLSEAGERVVAIVGANDSSTLREDVETLARLMRIPRKNGYLGVVSYGGAFFHPKTYHIRRTDGSEAAYVGSANLTAAGLSSLHVEAGLVIDTRTGDDPAIAAAIAEAIDSWCSGREGLSGIDRIGLLEELVLARVLANERPERAVRPAEQTEWKEAPSRARLQALVELPRLPAPRVAEVVNARPEPVERRKGYPDYFVFAPESTKPTSGLGGLTGTALPGGAAGVVIRLNKDSARHFSGGAGTANISIPVNTLSTIRFGIYSGRYERPRAEFELRVRYLTDKGTLTGKVLETNIMGYGFAPDEPGHSDVRMVVPAKVRDLGKAALANGLNVPADGDLAFLEWPTAIDPSFKLTLLDRGSYLYERANTMFTRAAAAGTLVGDGACWLPAGVSPRW